MPAWRALAPLLLLPPVAGAVIDEAEQRERIEFETRQFELRIENNELLFRDAALDAYLQEVIDRLFPDEPGRFRVRTFRDPYFNAFAVASGGVYFNTGTLLRLTDEAQLASVLGHEGTHVTADHVYRSVRGAKTTAGVTTFAGLIAAGAGIPPVLVGIVGLSSMAGFSREYERESDQGGFERLQRAGYDTRAGAAGFALLERELAARDVKQGAYFFASHPRVRERVATQAALTAAAGPGGETGAGRYLDITRPARLDALEQLRRAGEGKTLVFLLEQERLLETLPPQARYYLAEGYRLQSLAVRRGRGDRRPAAEIEAERARHAERAAAEYRRTIELAPEFAPAYEPLALHVMKHGDRAEALALFTRYVELSPDPKQSGYARQYIQTLTQEPSP